MKITTVNIIATGSTGNLYEIIDHIGNVLLIEAGVKWSDFVQRREGMAVPELCVISHKHSDHAAYAYDYELMCTTSKWKEKAESENFTVNGFRVKHGDVENYAYIIEILQDEKSIFFGTDMEWDSDYFTTIYEALRKKEVEYFLLEVNYNDYLYHLPGVTEDQKRGCDRHFSDNDAIRFIEECGVREPKIITIHGSDRLSADIYTKRLIKTRLPAAKVSVAIGWKNGVKDLKYLI